MATPTVAGFLTFVRGVMGVPTAALADDAPVITYAMNASLATVYVRIACLPAGIHGYWTPYEMAVYNLAGDFLINYAPDNPSADPPNDVYFSTLRTQFGCLSFVAGVISATFDQGTGETQTVPDWTKGLTLSDLQRLKTPYGRRYLEIAQSSGPMWGLT
jgi:hypothetical protein